MEFKLKEFSQYLSENTSRIRRRWQVFKIHLCCCDLCGGRCHSQTMICDYCLADLPLFDMSLFHGDLLTWPAINTLLPQRKFDQLITVAPYQSPLDLWVRQLKYHGRFELVNLLSSLLFQQWDQAVQHQYEGNDYLPTASLLLSVPIHVQKWQKRGFNQAHLLATGFASKTGIAYAPYAIKRISNDTSQAGKTGATRRKSLRHAFELSADFISQLRADKNTIAQHVLLLDDVVTTGSTCNEICRLLKGHGVKHITVLSLCLSLPDNKTQA